MKLPPLIGPLIDFALPPRCPACGTIVRDDAHFCAACWGGLDLLTGHGCAACNVPIAGPAGTVCANCLAVPPRHDGVFAAVAYGDTARDLAIRLKYGRRTGLARPMGAAMARHVAPVHGVLVPVPLHRWRLWWRGFNQSLTLARAVARHAGLPVYPDTLVRVRATPPMRGKSRKARADAVRGVFRVRGRLDGQTVWLVDDVYTTGATANACAAALKRAGAAEVRVLAWARVLRED